MRIALFFNPDAGAQTYSAADLVSLLRDAGHAVELCDRKRDGVKGALKTNPSVLVAAGGDGTVAKAAVGLAERAPHVPLYVLPLGTSNNIANTLGAPARSTVVQLVQALASARAARFDIGAASAPWGDAPFVEGAGVGFFGATMHRAESLRGRWRERVRRMWRDTRGEAEVRAAARGMARLIRGCAARRCTVIADGRDLSGEYLAVEVMNIRAIGPRMALAPGASYGDGELDVVLVRPDARESLARLVESGNARHGCCEVIRSREVQLSWPWRDGHLDDSPWPERKPRPADAGPVRLTLSGSIQVLLPASERPGQNPTQ